MPIKFKIGDKVRIVRLTTINGRDVPDDGHFIGVITTIKMAFLIQTIDEHSRRWGYSLATPDYRFFTDEELELATNALQRLKERYANRI